MMGKSVLTFRDILDKQRSYIIGVRGILSTFTTCTGSGILSHYAALSSHGEGRATLVCYSWWSVCKSMWRAKEQESRARLGLWKEGRERFKILNLRMALCLPLTKQINTVSNALDVYAPKPTDFALLPFPVPFHHCCPDHRFPFRACYGKLS